MPSIIGNMQIFPEVSVEIKDWISPALVLTRTPPRWTFSLIRRNLSVNPTRISPYPVKPDPNLTSQPTPEASSTTNLILTWTYPTLNLNPILTQSPSQPELTRLRFSVSWWNPIINPNQPQPKSYLTSTWVIFFPYPGLTQHWFSLSCTLLDPELPILATSEFNPNPSLTRL
jgi:hypothetical protein